MINMKRVFNYIAITICFLTANLHALIVEAPNLEVFQQALLKSDTNSLVLLDVDETLIIPKDLILRPCARKIWEKYAQQTLKNPEIVPPEKYEKDYFLSLVLSRMQYKLVDPEILNVIENLQKRQIKTIAFTKMTTGSSGVIPSLEDWRIAHLLKLNIDFSEAFPHFPSVQLEETNGRAAVFKQGVLCANKQDKGPVLIAFLAHIKWQPKKIFFLDNRLDYLQSVEQSLKGTGIEFIGFHYTAVENEACIVDEELAQFQLMHLAKTGIWLSDEEANLNIRR